MNLDVIGYMIVGAMVVWLFAVLSVIIKGSIAEWLSYRARIKKAKDKRSIRL